MLNSAFRDDHNVPLFETLLARCLFNLMVILGASFLDYYILFLSYSPHLLQHSSTTSQTKPSKLNTLISELHPFYFNKNKEIQPS